MYSEPADIFSVIFLHILIPYVFLYRNVEKHHAKIVPRFWKSNIPILFLAHNFLCLHLSRRFATETSSFYRRYKYKMQMANFCISLFRFWTISRLGRDCLVGRIDQKEHNFFCRKGECIYPLNFLPALLVMGKGQKLKDLPNGIS